MLLAKLRQFLWKTSVCDGIFQRQHRRAIYVAPNVALRDEAMEGRGPISAGEFVDPAVAPPQIPESESPSASAHSSQSLTQSAVKSVNDLFADVFGAALAVIREREPIYAKGGRVTESNPAYIVPRCFCDETLAEALCDKVFLQTRVRRSFFDWASAQAPESRLVPVLACHDQLARGEIPRARKFAQRALYLNQDDLYAQTLYRRCHPELPPEPDLRGKFCSRPFETLETQSRGRVFFCCTAWLPTPIGNLSAKNPDEIWNSSTAQDIRRSILDGSYRYCSRMHCPRLTADDLPRTDEVRDAEYREIIDKGRLRLPKGPRRVFLSHDRSCNLLCPSCRTSMIVAKKDEAERMNEVAERLILPLVRTTRRVHLTGSGDPFASQHFRYVLGRLTSGETPDLRIDLQTNGLLLKASWDDLSLDGYVGYVIVSIDAARPETYAVLRRGGRFDSLLENLEFLRHLRRASRVKHVRLDFVVQALNFREMPEAVEMMRAFGFDGIKFQMIRSWNTYTPEEFANHDIGSPDHPEFGAFLGVLKDRRLRGDDVEFYGFHSVDRRLLGDRVCSTSDSEGPMEHQS
jgi:sulfatase maturation enzyme AslB (radical SAM superfamily)